MHSKISIPDKNKISTTSAARTDTAAPTSSNLLPFITTNTKLQIHKWFRNSILITGYWMMSETDEKRLLKKCPVKVRPVPGASADDMHH